MKKVKSVKSPYGVPRWTVLLKATWSVCMLALAAAVNISCKVWTSSPSMNLASARKLLSAWLKIHREKSQEAHTHTHTSKIMYLSMAACVACVYISLCVCFFWWDLAVFSVTTCLFVVVWMTHCDLVSVTLQQQQQADKRLPITKSEVGQTKKHAYKHKKNTYWA